MFVFFFIIKRSKCTPIEFLNCFNFPANESTKDSERELRDLKVVVPKDLRLYLGASIGCCESWIYSIFTLVHFH